MTCQHCSTEIPANSNFCPHCGASFISQDVVDPAILSPPYKLNLGKLLEDTFELYKRNFGTMCLLGLPLSVLIAVFLPLHFAIFFIQLALGHLASEWFFLLAGCRIVLQIVEMILLWYIALGVMRHSLYLIRGGIGFQTNIMFPPFMMYLKLVGLFLTVGIICCVFIAPAGVCWTAFMFMNLSQNVDPGLKVTLLFTCFLLFLIGYPVTIWLSTRFYLAPFFLADRDAGVIDSLKSAWQASARNFWMLFLGMFILAICSMLGLFLLGVGYILTAAIGSLGGGLAYLQLTGQPNCLDGIERVGINSTVS